MEEKFPKVEMIPPCHQHEQYECKAIRYAKIDSQAIKVLEEKSKNFAGDSAESLLLLLMNCKREIL
jgi:hypothetical protein